MSRNLIWGIRLYCDVHPSREKAIWDGGGCVTLARTAGSMSSDSAAKRFYERSHRINPKGDPLTVQLGLNQIMGAGHRYHCVYQELVCDKTRRVCELGYGGPQLLSAISTLSGTYTIVDIVDRSSGMALPENVNFVTSDLNDDFPFENATFDVVIAMMVVEHLFDPFHSFRELARISRNDGVVLVNLPNITALKCRLSLLFGRMPVTSSRDWFEKREWDGNHLHYFTISDTIRLAALFGLRLRKLYSVGRGRALKNLAPSLFCHEISYVFDKR
jgi:SAM-dependent methyltransferase